ncbi:MAG: inositol monophosphatase family protein [Bryobacteraceae bacterium]
MSAGYARELAAAVRAATEAGQWLRREFHAPGSIGSSHPDSVVEERIRSILTAECPEHDYQGRTLGDRSGGSGACQWVVDPHNGGDAARAGSREATVAIGLVAETEPVMGVVFAYAAPDDDGDLFTWAEGHPLFRNGEVTRGRVEGTVLLPETADAASEDCARAVSPLRFRAVASAAYRLALVAAGEAEAAVCLERDADGHAAGRSLLTGAGVRLFAHSDGLSAGRLFDDVRWTEVIPRSRPSGDVLCGPKTGFTVRNAAMLRRAQGCWFGQLAGDSLGSLVEFESPASIERRYPGGPRHLANGGVWGTIAGQPTDDSEMALSLARTLVSRGAFGVEAIARAYAEWYDSGPFDMGGTTRAALAPASSARKRGASSAEAARASALVASQANGSLMRSSPLGIFGASHDAGDLTVWAREDASLTHPHQVCRDAAAVFVRTLAYAIAVGGTAREIYNYACEQAAQIDAADPVRQALESALRERPDYLHQSGWVLVALQNAFYQLVNAETLERGICDSAAQGGDTDTNAAIAGALLGAVYGREAVPPDWRDRILTCRPIAGLPGVKNPRPRDYWPVDALRLAERLLCPR